MKKIAIIGSGVSGLAAAYLLRNTYDVSLYEKNDYYGGHARTVNINHQPIDTGFIVFNKQTYPHLIALFKHLHIPIKKSDMSFGVSINQGQLEYGSKRMLSLFAQRSNFFKPRFWRMLVDIIKFNRVSKAHLKHMTLDSSISLEHYLQGLQVSDWFRQYYLFAMGAAIWSTPAEKMHAFPALTFIQFFYNHGLLDIHQPIQWYTVEGGSQVYVKKIVEALQQAKVKFYGSAESVIRKETVTVVDQNASHHYDKVIFATHSDQALFLLLDKSDEEQKILKAIPYQKNKIILHQDEEFMPKRHGAWSSWVYLSDTSAMGQKISLSYWMNSLQSLPCDENYFVTLNAGKRPAEHLILDEYEFEHPLFTKEAIEAQGSMEKIQGKNNTYYCGAYLRYGFHEDGILSAVKVAQSLGVDVPW